MAERERWNETFREDIIDEVCGPFEVRAGAMLDSAKHKWSMAEENRSYSATLPDEDEILSWVEQEEDVSREIKKAFKEGVAEREKIREDFEEASDVTTKKRAFRKMEYHLHDVFGSEHAADSWLDSYAANLSSWEDEEDQLSEMNRDEIEKQDFANELGEKTGALIKAIDDLDKASIPGLLDALKTYVEQNAPDGFWVKDTNSALKVLSETKVPFDPDEDPINAYLADQLVRLGEWVRAIDYWESTIKNFRAWCSYWLVNFDDLLELYVASLDDLPIEPTNEEGTTDVLFFDVKLVWVRIEELNKEGDSKIGPLWKECQVSMKEHWEKIGFRYYPKLKFNAEDSDEWAKKFGKLMAKAISEAGKESYEIHSEADLEYAINQLPKTSDRQFYFHEFSQFFSDHAVEYEDFDQTVFDTCLDSMVRMEELERNEPHDEEEFSEDVHLMTWKSELAYAEEGGDGDGNGDSDSDSDEDADGDSLREVETSSEEEDEAP